MDTLGVDIAQLILFYCLLQVAEGFLLVNLSLSCI